MKEKIILIGGGGHCKACIDVIELSGHFHIEGIIDVPDKLHQKLLGYEIIATDDDLPQLVNENKNFLVTLGQIKSPEKRTRFFQILKDLKAKLPIIISPLAYVSRHAQIDEGTIVMHHALVNAGAHVGESCIINTKALVEHDAVIGDHCHISTGAIVNGGVTVGSGTFFGSKSVSKEYVKIGRNVVIGCGEKITKNIP
jgi:sugar O-acyltransferase (sialic acid O-acetyltransferase NeuD family)